MHSTLRECDKIINARMLVDSESADAKPQYNKVHICQRRATQETYELSVHFSASASPLKAPNDHKQFVIRGSNDKQRCWRK